ANTYLRTQIRTIIILILVLTIAMFLSVALVRPTGEANELFCHQAVKTAWANQISANTDLSYAQTVTLLENQTAQQVAATNGYLNFRPERIAAGIECQQAVWWVAGARALAFVMGATFSATVGFIGMNMAVQGNVRVASACRRSFKESLTIAYRSGTITGMLTDGLGLLGGTFIFIMFVKAAPDVLLGFGFGATLIALFMRVGGGIYTKAADVGADLVGKVEASMEEDDPRNAAVIADLVGDNVGDCAGMAADIFESYEVTIVSSLILGLALTALTGELFWIILPLLVRGVGVISTIIGTYAVSLWQVDDAEEAMYKSYELSSVITIVATFLLAIFYAGHEDPSPTTGILSHLSLGSLVAVGVALAVAFNMLTAKATSANSERVQNISKATNFGPALVILEGMSLGYFSSVWAVLVIAASLITAVLVYSAVYPVAWFNWTLILGGLVAIGLIVRGFIKREIVNGFFYAMWVMVVALLLLSMQGEGLGTGHMVTYVLFGVSLIGVGMLSLTGNNVSMDTFGPIADNANGIGELVDAEFTPEARQIMADLDAAGNTTKAITKGVAIGSAVIAALSLFGAFFTDIERVMPADRLDSFERVINLADPTVFIGLILGGALPLLFGGLLIKAVNRAAGQIMVEVRRQLRVPAIWSGEKAPDYERVVGISTKAAQTELVPLGLIAILTPIVIGLLLKEQALAGFLAGVIMSGLLLAVFMSNSGGAWDNAKKYVEDGHFGGKSSENHKAAVVGDIVGDPLKDTAGPALNPMIKVINLVALIMAPIVVVFTGISFWLILFVVVCMGLIIWAIRRSDRPDHTVDEAMEERLTRSGTGASD
ncbi:MAG: sodium-translocating pyrophosphatase, partial [Chloroflexi bacterium]